MPVPQLSRKEAVGLYRCMVRIRTAEEEAGGAMEGGQMPGSLHLYVGQEAIAAGVCAHLRDTDQITSTHRGHGHLIAKGGELGRMFAELYGKSAGYCKADRRPHLWRDPGSSCRRARRA
jgi:pyruvate dehydrogenase E1 component alpha subunit